MRGISAAEVWFILKHDLWQHLRLPQVWAWMLVMPPALAYIVGTIMQGLAPHGERLGVSVPADGGFLAGEFIQRLNAGGFDAARISNANEADRYPVRVILPAGFTASVLNGPPAELDFISPAGYMLTALDRFRIQKTAQEMMADLALLSQRGTVASAASTAAIASEPRRLQLIEVTAGKPRKLVLGFQQSAPGFLVMFTLYLALTSGSSLLVAERRMGVLRRLACTPLQRGSIVAGKLGSRAVLGIVQASFAMLAESMLFGVSWGGSNLWAAVLLMICYAALCSSAALLFSASLQSEAQASAAGILAAVLLSALGGCWWPVEIMPVWMRYFSLLLPTGWAMDGLHRLMSYGDNPASVIPHIAAMVATAALAGTVASRRFRNLCIM